MPFKGELFVEKDITSALYDITLKGQSARDSEMLDIIFGNLTLHYYKAYESAVSLWK